MNFRARSYDVYAGVFIQPDTIVSQPGNPQSLNRYAFEGGNPLNRVDPSGHQDCAADDQGCWEQRWYTSHGYELGGGGWQYKGHYQFSDADALAELLADVANGQHRVAVGSTFQANLGRVTLSLRPTGQDTTFSNLLGAIGVGMDMADFGITGSFAALYSVGCIHNQYSSDQAARC